MKTTPLDDHFLHPRNAGVIDHPDVLATAENPVCGDRLSLYLRLGPAGKVAVATFKAYGCPAAIAAGSVLTELVVGRDPEKISAIREEAIEAALGGLDGEKRHACVLAADVLRAARADLAAGPGRRASGGSAE
jgi:NifU-like protein involved in Fe-S cluster formation